MDQGKLSVNMPAMKKTGRVAFMVNDRRIGVYASAETKIAPGECEG
jgi:hypothetical protein